MARQADEGVSPGLKQHLYEVAKEPGIEGRSSMTKDQLVDAIKKANRRTTARSRSRK